LIGRGAPGDNPRVSALLPFLATALRRHRPLFAACLALSLVTALVTALEPLVLSPAISAALGAIAPVEGRLSLNTLGGLLLAALGLDARADALAVVMLAVAAYVLTVAAAAALDFAAARALRRFRVLFAEGLQAGLHRHLLSLPLDFYGRARSVELAGRLVNDVALATQLLEVGLRWVVESSLLLLVYGTLLVRTDAWLTLSVAAAALLQFGITRSLETRVRAASAGTQGGQSELLTTSQESLAHARLAKSFCAERLFQERFEASQEKVRERLLRQTLAPDAEIPLRRAASALAVGAALVMSFIALAAGRLTLPGFVLFVFVVRQMMQPLSLLGRALLQSQAFVGASQRLAELLATPPSLRDGTREAGPLREAIELRSVWFGFSPETPVLRGIDLALRRGQVVALVGPTGSGKSTLADVLLRLHDPSAGCVLYDGIDVREFRQASVRCRVGVVPQQEFLLNASVAENIAYGRPANPADLERAATLANAHAFIMGLPEGYATSIGERGTRLSGGERQRIALARALYGEPELLVLDEATSALDGESERLVQTGIDRALVGVTALVIAHRLATVIRADAIVVLDAGKVVARGRHAGLLESCGLYRRLWDSQFSGSVAVGHDVE
jgi:subfamily B ATP-binding cassette protein MsbA